MQTSDFKTKTLLKEGKNPSNENYFVIGIDIGYSAVKGFAPNKTFCFPSYARKIDTSRISFRKNAWPDIYYRSDDGTWAVGEAAYGETGAYHLMDSEEELYGRTRYFSPMFLVLARTGMALGLMANDYGDPGGRQIKIQTGLPSRYMGDEPLIREALSGRHVFEVKVGNEEWMSFDITLNDFSEYDPEKRDIFVMPQPIGSLLSVCIDKDGRQVPEAARYFSSRMILFDPGFGTLDDYLINNGTVIEAGSNTWSEYGMREVFARTCRDIKERYHVEVSVPGLQEKLTDGKVAYTEIRKMKRSYYSFDDILEKNCRDVCIEAVEKMKVVHNYFQDIDYIIATGGTYEAWKDIFNDIFSEMEGLQIIPGNINDPSLSNVFSNVRGYYYYLNGNL